METSLKEFFMVYLDYYYISYKNMQLVQDPMSSMTPDPAIFSSAIRFIQVGQQLPYPFYGLLTVRPTRFPLAPLRPDSPDHDICGRVSRFSALGSGLVF
jgi:hypothetical protein